MYEKKSQPLASRKTFYKRLGRSLLLTVALTTGSLFIGIAGYHYLGKCEWIDAFHNASMILSGMGPVVTIETISGKIFSSFYALFSGLAFITNLGLLLAPALHRTLHKMHLDQ